MTSRSRLLAAALLALGACGGGEDAGDGTLPPPVVGYSLDSLAWFQEGRPVEFGGRRWAPVGRPVAVEPASLRAVGRFEDMLLYAARDDRRPFGHLFFPYGNGIWQTLEPRADSAQTGSQ